MRHSLKPRTIGTPPPLEHPQGSERVPPAGLAHLLQLKEGSPGMPVLKEPSSVLLALLHDYLDGVVEPLVAFCATVLEVVQGT